MTQSHMNADGNFEAPVLIPPDIFLRRSDDDEDSSVLVHQIGMTKQLTSSAITETCTDYDKMYMLKNDWFSQKCVGLVSARVAVCWPMGQQRSASERTGFLE